MTWWFECDHADLIASAAPNGAAASFLYNDVGRLETEVPFETAVTQVDLIVISWDMTEADRVADEADYRWSRWMSPTGTMLELIEHDWSGGGLGGHCYPGSPPAFVGCGSDTAVGAALQFYIDHPKDE